MNVILKGVFWFVVLLVVSLGGVFAYTRLVIASTPLVSLEAIGEMAEQGNFDQAVKAVKKRLAVDSGDDASAELLGNLYEDVRRPKKAEAIYRKILKKYPDDPWLYFYLGRSLYRQRRINDAVDALNKTKALASQLAPDERRNILPAAFGLLGEIYMQQTKEYRKAVEVLQEVVRLDPENWEMRYELATAYAYSGQYQSAYREYDKIIKENPDTDIAKYAENAIQYVREKRSPNKSQYLVHYV